MSFSTFLRRLCRAPQRKASLTLKKKRDSERILSDLRKTLRRRRSAVESKRRLMTAAAVEISSAIEILNRFRLPIACIFQRSPRHGQSFGKTLPNVRVRTAFFQPHFLKPITKSDDKPPRSPEAGVQTPCQRGAAHEEIPRNRPRARSRSARPEGIRQSRRADQSVHSLRVDCGALKRASAASKNDFRPARTNAAGCRHPNARRSIEGRRL